MAQQDPAWLHDLAVTEVITASASSWTAPFTALSPRRSGKLVTALRRKGADEVRRALYGALSRQSMVNDSMNSALCVLSRMC